MNQKTIKLRDIQTGNNLVTPPILVVVTDIGNARTGENKKLCYTITVTDGQDTVGYDLYDQRPEGPDLARQNILGKVVEITLKGEVPVIATIKPRNDISKEDVLSGKQMCDTSEKDATAAKRTLISDLPATGSARIPVMVTEIGPVKTSRNAKPYYAIAVTDGVQSAAYQRWANDRDTIAANFLEKPVYLTLELGEFTKIAKIEPCDIPVTEFIRKAPMPSEQAYKEITDVLRRMKSSMAPIVLNLYEANKENLLRWAGALKMHHAIYGGLLWHKYRMMKAAQSICAVYPNLNRELLVLGVLTHDIGKLRELETSEVGATAFTIDGSLNGHVLMGIEMLNEAVHAAQYDVNAGKPDDEEYRQVKHMIASHHGALEYGAIALPATPEAMVLNNLDMIDSRMYTFEEVYANMESGTLSDRVFQLGNVHVYKPAPSQGDADSDE